MNYLSPAFLWALPLVSVPLILHLMSRRPHKKILFSHVPWLKEVHRKLMPRKRLEEILILIIRTLLLLFLVGFFSRPLVQPLSLNSKDKGASSLVILLDTSASMGAMANGRPLLEAAKENVKRLLQKIPSGTKVGWVAYSNRVEWESPPASERSKALTAMNGLPIQPRPTDLIPALASARKFIESQPGETRLLFISDQARHGWETLMKNPSMLSGFPEKTSFHLWEAGAIAPNEGISEVSFQWGESGVLKGRAVINHDSPESAKGPWKVWLEGRVAAQGDIKDARGESEEVPFECQVPMGGSFSGEVRLPGDDLAFDDVYYFAGRTPRGYRLLVVEGEMGLAPSDSETYYLRSSLENPKDSRVQSLQVVSLNDLTALRLQNADVVVLANTGSVLEKDQMVLDWVNSGGGLLMSAGGRWPTSGPPLHLFASKGRRTQTLAVAPVDLKNEFFKKLGTGGGFEWPQITVSSFEELSIEGEEVPLLKLSNESPLLMMKKLGKGRVACLATTLSRSWTNFPVKPAFAPLMRELLAELAGPDQGNTAFNGFVDEAFRIPLPSGVTRVTVTTPDGTGGAGRLLANGIFEWPTPQQAGIYQARTNLPRQDFSFAINIAHQGEEGNLKRVKEGEIKKIFPHVPVFFVPAGPKSMEHLLSTLMGKDLTGFCLAAVIGLFLLETLLVFLLPRRREKSS